MGKADFLLGTCRERIVLFNGDVGAEDDNHDMQQQNDIRCERQNTHPDPYSTPLIRWLPDPPGR